ncbi:MAG: hypothetical protein KAR25_06390 [Methanosarcinales archaeon]|nr:hypothetical protein [Methanosarcinales archaeon]
MNEIELVQSLIDMVKALQYKDLTELDAIGRRAGMIIINIHGENSRYLNNLNGITFLNNYLSEEENKELWISGQSKVLNLFNTMLEELELFGTLK